MRNNKLFGTMVAAVVAVININSAEAQTVPAVCDLNKGPGTYPTQVVVKPSHAEAKFFHISRDDGKTWARVSATQPDGTVYFTVARGGTVTVIGFDGAGGSACEVSGDYRIVGGAPVARAAAGAVSAKPTPTDRGQCYDSTKQVCEGAAPLLGRCKGGNEMIFCPLPGKVTDRSPGAIPQDPALSKKDAEQDARIGVVELRADNQARATTDFANGLVAPLQKINDGVNDLRSGASAKFMRVLAATAGGAVLGAVLGAAFADTTLGGASKGGAIGAGAGLIGGVLWAIEW